MLLNLFPFPVKAWPYTALKFLQVAGSLYLFKLMLQSSLGQSVSLSNSWSSYSSVVRFDVQRFSIFKLILFETQCSSGICIHCILRLWATRNWWISKIHVQLFEKIKGVVDNVPASVVSFLNDYKIQWMNTWEFLLARFRYLYMICLLD